MPQLQCFKIPVSAFKLPCARAITIMGSSNFEKIQTWWTLQKKQPAYACQCSSMMLQLIFLQLTQTLRKRGYKTTFLLNCWFSIFSRPRPQPSATVRNRPQPFATVRVRTVWPCLWEVLQRWSFLEVSDVSLLRFAWQAWHFVTFRRVLQRVENRFAWQAQYLCDVFRRCVAVFVAGAALWTCPSSFFVAGAAL